MSDCGMSTGADAGGGPGHNEDRGHVLDSGYNDQDQHGYSDHDREMTYDSREQKYLGEEKIYPTVYLVYLLVLKVKGQIERWASSTLNHHYKSSCLIS